MLIIFPSPARTQVSGQAAHLYHYCVHMSCLDKSLLHANCPAWTHGGLNPSTDWLFVICAFTVCKAVEALSYTKLLSAPIRVMPAQSNRQNIKNGVGNVYVKVYRIIPSLYNVATAASHFPYEKRLGQLFCM